MIIYRDVHSKNCATLKLLEKIYYRVTSKITHMSTIRIFDLKCHKSKALNGFSQTNSNNTQMGYFRGNTVGLSADGSPGLQEYQKKNSDGCKLFSVKVRHFIAFPQT
jgi:hypothetical protein